MGYYIGLDVSLKQTAICVVDEAGNLVWQGASDTHSEMITHAVRHRVDALVLIGLETGSSTPWLARALQRDGLPVVVMDARRASMQTIANPMPDSAR